MSSILVAATGNLHKVAEMQSILSTLGITVVGADAVGGLPEVVEDGLTFAANAIKKAVAAAQACQQLVVADDSGLEVLALSGRPGIHSARYAGIGGNDGRNLTKLLQEMDGIADRRARFVAVIAVAEPQGLIGTATGIVQGRLAEKPRGTGGFGYDPAFVPEGYTETFAELPPEVKNKLSHRARALQEAVKNSLFEKLRRKD